MKTCSCCNISKELSQFNKDKNKKDGHHSFCRDCYKIKYSSKFNPAYKNSTSYESRKEYHRKYIRKKRNDYQRIWKKENVSKEKRKEYKQRYKANHIKTVRLSKLNSNRTVRRLREIPRLILLYKDPYYKYGLSQLVGWTKIDFISRFDKIPAPTEHIDHKIPLSWFDESVPAHIANHLENLQILSSKENLSKHNRYCSPVLLYYYDLCRDYIKNEYKDKVILI